MLKISERIEPARGCGYRKPGGLYLVSGPHSGGCCRLPIPLTVCPTCNAGIKPTRGFQWISGELFTTGGVASCPMLDSPGKIWSSPCPMSQPPEKLGLMWVGEKYYPSAAHFVQEARTQGISKRLAALPLDLVIGQTWVALAHRCAIVDYSEGPQAWVDEHGEAHTGIKYLPGIFMFFRPQAVEYVVKPVEDPAQLERMQDRGVSLVRVVKDIDAQTELDLDDQDLDEPELSNQNLEDYE